MVVITGPASALAVNADNAAAAIPAIPTRSTLLGVKIVVVIKNSYMVKSPTKAVTHGKSGTYVPLAIT